MRARFLAALAVALPMAAGVSCGRGGTAELDTVGMEVLGSGYDLTGNYADVGDVKAAVLDLQRLAEDGRLRPLTVERATYRVVSGRDSHEFQRSLAIAAHVEGEYKSKTRGVFSGALKGSFGSERYESRDYSFATVQSLIRKRGLRVVRELDPMRLREYLTAAAEQALKDTDPEILFERYGTHVLTGVFVGGRLDYKTSADMSFETKGRTIDVYARAGFEHKMGSGSIELETVDQKKLSEFTLREQKDLEVFGGRSEFGQEIVNAEDYDRWIDTVDENAVFVDFAPDGLLGIWELIDDEGHRAAVKRAWSAYAEERGITLAGEIVRSSFEVDADEWRVARGDGPKTGDPGKGYSGGYIWAKDQSASDSMVFVANSDYLGDKSEYLGGNLEYRLWAQEECFKTVKKPTFLVFKKNAKAACSPIKTGPLVQIVSSNDDLYCYSPDLPSCDPPYGQPTDYDIQLVAGRTLDVARPGGRRCACRWEDKRGEPVDDCDLLGALRSVQGLYLYGEFQTGWDFTALDEVSLTAPDEPLELDCLRDRSSEDASAPVAG